MFQAGNTGSLLEVQWDFRSFLGLSKTFDLNETIGGSFVHPNDKNNAFQVTLGIIICGLLEWRSSSSYKCRSNLRNFWHLDRGIIWLSYLAMKAARRRRAMKVTQWKGNEGHELILISRRKASRRLWYHVKNNVFVCLQLCTSIQLIYSSPIR